MRYRPNCAALSDVPRATSTTSFGRSIWKCRRNSPMAETLSSSVRASATGCSRVSSSILDIRLWLLYFQKAVRRNIRQLLDPTRRPANLDGLNLLFRTQSEVHPLIARRHESDADRHMV